MIKKLFFTVLGVALVVGALVYAKLGQFTALGKAAEMMVMPPETVTAMVVTEDTWERTLRATGTMTAVQGVTIGAEAGGRIKLINFESGTFVAQGQILLELDTSSEEAQLASAQAAAALERANLVRTRELSQRKIASPAELEAAESRTKSATASVVNMRAQIAKRTVRAPFSGRLGIRQVNLGQILQPGDPIVSLQSLNPIHADFSVPQQKLSMLAQKMPVRVTSDAAPGRTFDGVVTAVSPEVDSATRNLRVRALVDNADELLRAGMFVEVAVVLPENDRVLAIAASAVLFAAYGNSVFVIETRENEQSGESERFLRQQFVRLGRKFGDFVAVEEGLTAGNEVVTSGVFKLRSGMTVVIDNAIAPQPQLKPTPSDS